MTKKIALCRVSDCEPLRSLLPMLEVAGYECVLPNRALRDWLRSIGCGNVDEPKDMEERWGAEPLPNLPEIGPGELGAIDLYIDVNAFANGPKVWKEYPRLKDRTLCYFINGGPPRNTADKGDGITPACPVMTTNQWYATNTYQVFYDGRWNILQSKESPWRDKSYVFYPSFSRWDRIVPRTPDFGGSPVCFCHNVMGWGYGEERLVGSTICYHCKGSKTSHLIHDEIREFPSRCKFCKGEGMTHERASYIQEARKLGCKFYGGGNSPDGLVRHEDVFAKLAKAPCVVYLKGGGAVDYAVLEAMAMGVPVFTTRQYKDDTRLHDLLMYEHDYHASPLTKNIARFVETCRLSEPNFNLGECLKERVKELCWQPERDGPGFRSWMGRMGFL